MALGALTVESPYTGETVFEAPLCGVAELDGMMTRARVAHMAWKKEPLGHRQAVVQRFLRAFEAQTGAHAVEIAACMGKPVRQGRNEVRAMVHRAEEMLAMAPEALANVHLPAKTGFDRWIAREPVGVVVVFAAWNYPLLIPINPLVAALLAGNAVVLKHSSRTPCCAEQFTKAWVASGGPQDLVTAIHADHAVCEALAAHPSTGLVSFTGSVAGGRKVYEAVARARFIDVVLELGGKDAAYVAADCAFEDTVSGIADGAFYNAGQGCCAVERVYVEAPLYDRFIEAVVEAARDFQPGDPSREETSLGPMAQAGAPAFLEAQVQSAAELGARVLVGGRPATHEGRGRFFLPTVVADTDHRMAIMREESFGPILAVAKVSTDEEALGRINDSPYGLTASIWTSDVERAKGLAQKVEAGTVFMNRADYLDPMLAWTGVKDSGKGVSLSHLGFHAVTRPKSFHFRTVVAQ